MQFDQTKDRRVLCYQSGNQKPYADEGQTKQLPMKKDKMQKIICETLHKKQQIEQHGPY